MKISKVKKLMALYMEFAEAEEDKNSIRRINDTVDALEMCIDLHDQLESVKQSKEICIPEKFADEEMLKMDGYDDCIAGVVEQFGRAPIVCYDTQKVLCKLEQDGMTPEEAEEFWSFNQIGAWVGESTPCFITKCLPKQD